MRLTEGRWIQTLVLLMVVLGPPSAAADPSVPLILHPLSFILSLSSASQPATATPRTGPWRAWLDSPGGELPFGLELAHEQEMWTAFIINGEERIKVPRISWDGRELLIDIDYYNSRITATTSADGSHLDGEWTRTRREGQVARMPFHAVSGQARRFHPDKEAAGQSTAAPPAIDGRWTVKFSQSDEPAVAVFHLQPDAALTGTVLAPGGDYGFLAGNIDGDRVRLSAFDGAHVLLFDARLQPDGTLQGDFWARDTVHETWSARRDPHAALPDAFERSESVAGIRLSDRTYPDLEGTPRSLNDPAFRGRARIVEVFGSWCPNCHDASQYLGELDKRYRDRGLRILGLGFEMSGDFKTDAASVRKYAARHGVTYPMLIVGTPGKEKVAEALPGLTDFRAYPTTLFLDADNRVRAVHAGFSGPATGEDYAKLRAEFETIIEKLLAEAPPTP